MKQNSKKEKKGEGIVIILFAMLFIACNTNASKPDTKESIDIEQNDVTHNHEEMAEHDISLETSVAEDVTNADLIVPQVDVSYDIISFREIWAYLIEYDEKSLNQSYPVSDIGYFGAGLSTFGKLVGVPSINRLSNYTGRVHLVIADNSRSLTHFCIDPSFSVRTDLISSILEAVEPFDGVQIDFELVSTADKEYFWSFLRELKQGLGSKYLSVALPARTKTVNDDAYDYKTINDIVDRIIIMAYDEHWSGSKPGSIASLDWCKNVASYAHKVISVEKLIMGLPFYGRAWSDDDTTGAYRFSSIERVIGEQHPNIVREQGVSSFSFSKTVTFTFYFEDLHSLYNRLLMYKDMSTQSVAFWRLGQEDASVWQYLYLE